MKKYFFFFFVFFILLSLKNISYASLESKILAKVENQLISSFELKNKIKLILFLTNQQINQKNVNNTKREALDSLINIKLKKEEILKFNLIDSSTNRADKYILNLATRYSTDLNGLKNIFNTNGIDYEIFFEEIKIEMAWQKMIFRIYKDKININDDEINKELEIMIKNNNRTKEYRISEIEILINNNSELKTKIEDIKKQIIEIGFENTAIKFSSSPSALNGGDLGWINSSSLSEKVLRIVNKIKINEVSEPLIQGNSVLFLKLKDIKSNVNDVSNIEQLKNRIVNAKQNKILNLFSNSHLSKVRNNALIEIK